jgi:serine protease inhibitor
MKRMFVLMIILLTLLCGCKRKNETVIVYSRKDISYDNININLKSGYWVEDYNIDYENNVITLNLYEDDVERN